MELVYDIGMTNDPIKIIKIYRENKNRMKNMVDGGESEVNRIIHDFFSKDNCVLRLLLYKDRVNKSKRKTEVPLYQFYVSMLPEEKLIYMVSLPNNEVKLS